MKTRDANVNKLNDSLMRLLPPPPHRVSLSRGRDFSKGVRDLLSKYVVSTTTGVEAIKDGFLSVSPKCQTYGDFLIYSQTMSSQEPRGTYLFSFKQTDTGSSIDMLFTPTSLARLSRMDADSAPQTNRIACVWYGHESGLLDAIPNFEELLETGSLHQFLAPVGPLVQTVHSTFVTKVTSALKGDVVAREPVVTHIGLTLPSDMFVDLDDSCPSSLRDEPLPAHSSIYVCLTYIRANNRPALGLGFFKSGKGYCEIAAQLRDFYSGVIRTKYIQLQNDLYINRLAFGVVCRLGSVPSGSQPSFQSLHFKGAALPVLKFTEFVSNPGSWKLFL
ncbi:JM122 [macacine gammaherpesvirus 11]|uniref:JM122 n=2 Tax=macacine gammaherpesvirus 11 TaxID=2560570 RepID=G9JMV0_9GAMA|nr:JM122 [Macaca fuscata rhadinovirus]AAT00099.1 JM122 [Macaca fuscata rhadinovirus]AEW87647.1 JM122 [Macaca fuscata rhadinovirus]AEW87817.1 JM122 [Macaca fuscata rhadinovirus]